MNYYRHAGLFMENHEEETITGLEKPFFCVYYFGTWVLVNEKPRENPVQANRWAVVVSWSENITLNTVQNTTGYWLLGLFGLTI